MTDARGNTNTVEYTERGLVAKTTNADASFRTIAYDSFGNVTNRVDELGHSTRMGATRPTRILRAYTNMAAVCGTPK